MPFKMQLAIQGGGAKLALLMAAASPLQKLIRDKKVVLTRVVGTSAGSIVAAMLAADIDIEVFRTELLGEKGKELQGQLKEIDWVAFIKVLTSGNPIWDEEKILIDLLRPMFEKKKIFTIADVSKYQNTELKIVSTDLGTLESVIAAANDPVLRAISESCGLPFAFKTWKTGAKVDGGITQNFASQELAEFPGATTEHGHIVGIMFDQERRNNPPKNAKDFLLALLNAAIDSATERARQSLSKAQIFSIPAEFDTFDFDKALEQGLKSDYNRIADLARRWFEDFIVDPEAIRGDIWKGESLATMSKTAQMYMQQHSQRNILYECCSLAFHARGLAREEEYDIVEYTMVFHTLEHEIFCHKLSLTEGEDRETGGFLKSKWTVVDIERKEVIEVTYVPMVDETTPAKREVLAYFHPVLRKGAKFQLTVRDLVKGLSKTLSKEGQDPQLMSMLRSDQPIGEIQIVVHIPENDRCKKAHLQSRSGTHPGEGMTKFELSSYRSDPGYRTLGWKGTDIPARYLFGPVLHL